MVTPSGPTFSMEDFITASISFITGLFRLLASSCFILVVWMDQKINPFLLDFPT